MAVPSPDPPSTAEEPLEGEAAADDESPGATTPPVSEVEPTPAPGPGLDIEPGPELPNFRPRIAGSGSALPVRGPEDRAAAGTAPERTPLALAESAGPASPSRARSANASAEPMPRQKIEETAPEPDATTNTGGPVAKPAARAMDAAPGLLVAGKPSQSERAEPRAPLPAATVRSRQPHDGVAPRNTAAIMNSTEAPRADRLMPLPVTEPAPRASASPSAAGEPDDVRPDHPVPDATRPDHSVSELPLAAGSRDASVHAAGGAVPRDLPAAEAPRSEPRPRFREIGEQEPVVADVVSTGGDAILRQTGAIAFAGVTPQPAAHRESADARGPEAATSRSGRGGGHAAASGAYQGVTADLVRVQEPAGGSPVRASAMAGALAELLGAGEVQEMVVERSARSIPRHSTEPKSAPPRPEAARAAPLFAPRAPVSGEAVPVMSAGPARPAAVAVQAPGPAPGPAPSTVLRHEAARPVDRGPESHAPIITESVEVPVGGQGAAPVVRPRPRVEPVPVPAAAPGSRQAIVATRPGTPTPPNVPASRQELPRALPARPEPAEPERTGAGDTASGPSSMLTSLSAPVGEPVAPADGRVSALPPREARNLPNEGDVMPRAAGIADRVTITVADDAGQQTRIRVAVVGEQVRATIVPPDGESARQLERRMDDLTAALVRRGFAEPRVTIQRSTEAGPVWAGAANGVRTDVEVPRGTEQPAGDQRQGHGRREQERQGDGQQRHPQGRPRQRDPDDRGR